MKLATKFVNCYSPVMARKRTSPQQKPARSQEFEKGPTGRYTVAATERAWKLRKEDPSEWRRLPRNLRTQAAENDRLHRQRIEEPMRLEFEIPRLDERIELIRAHLETVHPKLRELARLDKSVGNLPFEDVANVAPEIAEHLSVPAQPGRPVNKELLELVRRRLSEGVSQRQIAREAYPGVSLDVAYGRLRAFVKHHKLFPRR